jgi:hypothetical protein
MTQEPTATRTLGGRSSDITETPSIKALSPLSLPFKQDGYCAKLKLMRRYTRACRALISAPGAP